MKDSIVDAVVKKYQGRSEVGIKKYNKTLDREDLNIQEWLTHAQEEAMDLTLYLEKIKSRFSDMLADAYSKGRKSVNEEIVNEIVTVAVYPPIPISDFDYQAVREGYDKGDAIGYGSSKQEAIDDLIDKED
jgi:hypothetical protein